MLVISCHADTGFSSHSLRRRDDGTVTGNLDNFAGVYAVMQAYFSGRLSQEHVRIELTYGEEEGCIGAREVLDSLNANDIVIVVDVTGADTSSDFTIEKCRDAALQALLCSALTGMRYDLHEGCPDPISDADEVDVYIEKCRLVCFMGVPCTGGDYNTGHVTCRLQSIESVAEAICRIAEKLMHLA